MNLWIPENVSILIDEYDDKFPKGNLYSLDIETNEKEPDDEQFSIVCIGLSDGISCWVFYRLDNRLVEFLRNIRWITHDGIHAELPWLNKLYGGFSPENIHYDTKIGAYAHDSTRKNYSLKPLIEEYLGIKYPTYADICGNATYIAEACERNPELRVKTKKQTKQPKHLTLDKLSREIVAQYNYADTYWTYKLWEYFRKNATTAEKQFFENIEMPMNRLISRMESRGIKVDLKELARLHEMASVRRNILEKITKERAKKLISLDEFLKEVSKHYKKKESYESLTFDSININSWRHILAILWAMGIKVKNTEEDTLIPHKKNKFVRVLLRYRGYEKFITTYTGPLQEEGKKNELTRIYTRFGQNTLTGRLSSSDPINLQNQPPEVRSGFITEPDSSFLDGDWSNLEIYLPAHFSRESQWIDILRQPNGDLHMSTAARLFGESVYSLPEADRKIKRKIAKGTLLTITNSGTFRSLAKTLQCSDKEAQEFEKATKNLYPTFVKWLYETKKKAREQKGISTYFGRWVRFPQLTLWCGRPNCDEISAKRHEFCKPCFMRQETEKQAISVKVQGTGGDLCKLAALRLYKEYGYVPNALVHDEILLEVPDAELEVATKRMKYVMEHLYDFVVPLKAEIKIAKNWKAAH